MMGKYDNCDDETFNVIWFVTHKLLNEQEGCEDVDGSQESKS